MNLRSLIVLSLLALPVGASEEKPLPPDLPAYGADRPIPVPRITQKTLPNGLSVWLVQREGFPKVTLRLAIRGGMAHDSAGQAGVSNLFASLLTEGTSSRTSKRIAEELQTVGGEIGAFASSDATYLYVQGLGQGLPLILDVLADVTQNSAFPEKEVTLAKANALQGLKAQSANPGFQANKVFAAQVFRTHPYSRVTLTEAVIDGVTPASLKQLRDRRFRPDRALLVVAGDFKEEIAFKHINKVFGTWKASGEPEAALDLAPQDGHREILLLERPGSVQSTLRVGRASVPAASPEAIPLALANVIMGGSFDSRITKNIREDKGYTYSPDSSVQGRQVGGMFQVRADVRNAVTAASLMEIFYEMDRMATTPVPEHELQRAKRYMGGIYLFQNQLQNAVAGTLATYWVNGLPPEFLGSFVEKVGSVKAEEVRAVSEKFFNPKDLTIVVVGDSTKIRKELEHFGPVKDIKP